MLPTACLTIFFDIFQTYLQGIVKALGIQKRAVLVTVFAYMILYTPLAYLMAFKLDWKF